MLVVEDGEMVGFVIFGDVVKVWFLQLVMEKDVLEGMIMGY